MSVFAPYCTPYNKKKINSLVTIGNKSSSRRRAIHGLNNKTTVLINHVHKIAAKERANNVLSRIVRIKCHSNTSFITYSYLICYFLFDAVCP